MNDRSRIRRGVVLAVLVLATAACTSASNTPSVCMAPGVPLFCTCSSGGAGNQLCNDGGALGPCVCVSTDAGVDVTGTDIMVADVPVVVDVPVGMDVPEADDLPPLIDVATTDTAGTDVQGPTDVPVSADVPVGTDVPTGAVAAPRPIAPLSTATVTSRRPALHWALPSGVTGAHVQICSNRAMTTGCVAYDAVGTQGAPPANLTPGVAFWQVYGSAGGVTGTVASPVWEFFVGASSALVDTSWGTVPDFNGDGYADVVVAAQTSNTVYVYPGAATGLSSTPTAITGGTAASTFGSAIASAGDINGDGIADLVVSAGSATTVYVYLGSTAGLSSSPMVLNAPPGSAVYGQSVSSAGDINGDGYADVIVGADGSNTAYVYMGSAGGVSITPTTVIGPAGSSAFGISVAGAGDLNGDGFADVIVGASLSNTAYAYLGGPAGLAAPPGTLTGSAGASFGGAVAGAGDVNGDGYTDAIVGAVGSSSASVYLGGAGGLTTAPTVLTQAGMHFGGSLSTAWDINGDGYNDVVVGAATDSAEPVWVYLGSAIGLGARPTVLPNIAGSVGYGWSVTGTGDVDGDGFNDVVVGSHGNTAWIYHGGATGISVTPTSLTGPSGSGLGNAVAVRDESTPSSLGLRGCRLARRASPAARLPM